jgi:membrane-associated phospholipid phosphatase
MKRGWVWAVAILVLVMSAATTARAGTNSQVESAGTAIAIALPVMAGGISLLHHEDWDGVAELTVSTAATVGVAFVLKKLVREQRPDHSDFESFPSDTAALAYSSADYLWARYGWEYGVPAYAAASFVGYSRVDAKKHHWYDVAASGLIALGINYAIVTRYHANSRYSVYASADPDSIGIHFAMNW